MSSSAAARRAAIELRDAIDPHLLADHQQLLRDLRT